MHLVVSLLSTRTPAPESWMKLRHFSAVLIPLAATALYYATPNFDHLPPSIRPHRPLPILAINAIGGLFALSLIHI